tara:strand:+ start:148 stop:1080 length:933 start_codon:yes stop_codon:yes gene_type:complete
MPQRPNKHPVLAQRLTWEDLDQAHMRDLIQLARKEDLTGAGLSSPPENPTDVTTNTFRPSAEEGQAAIVAREPITICGLSLVPLILEAFGGGTFTSHQQDAESTGKGTTLGILNGNPSTLLKAERILLNFLQHLCGIATNTSAFAERLSKSPTRLLDTRKTTPGLRVLEKYAVACGGGWNHRIGLFDRVLIKDNHLAAFSAKQGKALIEAVRLARQKNPGIPVEIEIDQLEQVLPALEAGADCLLLDNFSPALIGEAIALVKGRTSIEASGGITLANIADYAQPGLDFISTGALVHHSRWTDIGLDWLET